MAFHLHLIDELWGAVPAQLQQDIEPVTSAVLRPLLRWGLGDDGRLHARWTHACD